MKRRRDFTGQLQPVLSSPPPTFQQRASARSFAPLPLTTASVNYTLLGSALSTEMAMGKKSSTPTLVGKCLALATLAAVGASAQNLPVPPLPYSYSSLVPFISEHALRVRIRPASITLSFCLYCTAVVVLGLCVCVWFYRWHRSRLTRLADGRTS